MPGPPERLAAPCRNQPGLRIGPRARPRAASRPRAQSVDLCPGGRRQPSPAQAGPAPWYPVPRSAQRGAAATLRGLAQPCPAAIHHDRARVPRRPGPAWQPAARKGSGRSGRGGVAVGPRGKGLTARSDSNENKIERTRASPACRPSARKPGTRAASARVGHLGRLGSHGEAYSRSSLRLQDAAWRRCGLLARGGGERLG